MEDSLGFLLRNGMPLEEVHRLMDHDGLTLDQIAEGARRVLERGEGLTGSTSLPFSPFFLQWEDPIPFDEVETPPFPVDCLPAPAAAFVDELSESTQTPPEMSAAMVLGVLAIAFQGRYTVRVTPDWSETLSLYLVSVAAPGERKSAVVSAVTKPVFAWEAKQRDVEAVEIMQNKAERDLLEKRLEVVKKVAASAKSREQMEDARADMLELSAQLAGFKDLHATRLIVDDTTPEKLVDLMNEQGGKIAIISSEGGVFDAMTGRYDRANNFDVYLKAHCGDFISIDRIGRKSNHVESPRLTMALAVQPDVIQGLMGNATLRGRGLCGRFLYAVCRSKVGRRKVSPPPMTADTKRKYSDFVISVLSGQGHGEVILSNEANRLREEYQSCIEVRLGSEWENMRDWGNKLTGAMVRIAALLHLSSFPDDEPINAEVMTAAIKIAEFFGVHARAAYQVMGANAELDSAKYIWDRIDNADKAVYSKSEIVKLCKGRFRKVDDMGPALQMLVDMGYLREAEQETGGRPKTMYIVNPRGKKEKKGEKPGLSIGGLSA